MSPLAMPGPAPIAVAIAARSGAYKFKIYYSNILQSFVCLFFNYLEGQIIMLHQVEWILVASDFGDRVPVIACPSKCFDRSNTNKKKLAVK